MDEDILKVPGQQTYPTFRTSNLHSNILILLFNPFFFIIAIFIMINDHKIK